MGGGTKVVLIIVACILILIGQGFQFYQDKQYEGVQAKEWLWRARATNDLNDMAKYLSKSEDLLQDYHGNPQWLYPTPDTDFDLIRENINESISNCYKWSGNTTSDFAYQQAVHNLQETIKEIAEHLDSAIGCIGGNPGMNPLGAMLWIILPTTIVCVLYGYGELDWFENY
jgi:hypothetical protein